MLVTEGYEEGPAASEATMIISGEDVVVRVALSVETAEDPAAFSPVPSTPKVASGPLLLTSGTFVR